MTSLCHECGEPIDADGRCPNDHKQAQPCPTPDDLRAACEAIRRTWRPERLAANERRGRSLECAVLKHVTDGMVRRNHHGL
jgi:hypothetical protein